MRLGFKEIVFVSGFLACSTMPMVAETIKGTIVDKQTKEPLTGATVQVLGSTVGAVADLDGNYILDVPGGVYDLVVKYVGYTDIKAGAVKAKGKDVVLNFEMESDAQTLSEVSVVAEGADAGKNLTQLMEEYKEKLVGEENYKRFQGKFPLLIKFIDAKQDLSIQVHPDDELAMKRHQSMGKTEMWYIIDNTGGKAHLYSGLKKQITPQEYADMIENNTICDALDKYDVQPGDVFFLPAGRIHSIGAGCFLAEIQQTSNITYRIYDFNRRDKNGNLRELHTELSKDAIDYTVSDDYRTHYEPRKDEPVELVSCPYFTTSVYNLTETMNMDYSELDSFVIYICMKGACTVTDNEGNRISVKAGESVLFPATTQNLEVVPEGEVSFLETYV